MDAQNLDQGHFDRNNPLSLYNKMGEKWASRFVKTLSETPCCADLLTNETVLLEHLSKNHNFSPTGGDNRYRLQLWLEYENSIKMERPMKMSNIYSLVGPDSTFIDVVMKIPHRVVWLLCKPIAYQVKMREMLDTGITRLRSYLDVDALTAGKGGKPDMRLMKMQMEITRMADLREHGAPTQKIQSLELKGTIGPNGELQAAVDKMDMAALQDRKKQLEERRKKAEGRAAAASGTALIVDVEVIKDEGQQESASTTGSGDDSGVASDA